MIKKNGNKHYINGIESVFEYIDSLPEINEMEIPHGHWTEVSKNSSFGKCSVCGEESDMFRMKEICPNCKTRLSGPVRESDRLTKEELRNAIMRLSMCSYRHCKICKYYGKRRNKKKCEKIIKECQDVLAKYCLEGD